MIIIKTTTKTYIKTTTKTYTPTAVSIDFLIYNEGYRKIRKNSKYQGFSCFNCHKNFEDNEKISLVMFNETSNKVVCRICADLILKDLQK